jgi:PAS domain S-box-containing protein
MKKRPKKITLAKKKTQKRIPENNVRTKERRHLARRVSDRDKTRNYSGEMVRQHADQLKIKNGELKNGVEKQERLEEQIHIRTKAMESTAEGIFIIDAQKPDFPVIYANPAFQTMTGYSRRDIIGQDYFFFHGTEANSPIVNEIKETISKGKSFHGEILNFQKDGRKYWNLLRIAPVRDASGSVTHYVGIQTDVTLMRERELEIEEQREELLHVTRVGKLAEFVSSLAHEISQPLTAILSYAQAGQRMLSGGEPELQKILSYIINDDQRAADVIQRLRSLLKKNMPESKPINISTLINETIMLIATDAIVRNNFIKTELDIDLPLVRGDRIQLQQVLLNLISNSFDAMEDSSEPREILIRSARKDAGSIIVEVKDSGCGIPAQNIPKLFTHFFTSKPDGLGMGLSISRSIIEAHGGLLDVKNNPDRGATFYFTIPVDKKDA